ncbi:hypothetical protein PE066_03855 [Ramlibacter tataouinensis]|uniref:hypothetical protein n=1 Tax=Ramlibacter tataouinensis TaxID=94132 RepID=UPI0022F39EDC|nr:hypothetical protein [Ramlibacter tataouinensis]WBY02684.1 hypothetical protein PE066_03855 [Ramlibacter tataouinensis]
MLTTEDGPSTGPEHLGEAPAVRPSAPVPLSRTRLIDRRSRRRDDAQVLALIRDLPGPASNRCHVFTAGLLNEAGELYREVDLHGEFAALLFTARMNANGFCRLQAGEPFFVDGYESVFAKR